MRILAGGQFIREIDTYTKVHGIFHVFNVAENIWILQMFSQYLANPPNSANLDVTYLVGMLSQK